MYNQKSDCATEFNFINKLLACREVSPINKGSYKLFENELRTYFKEQTEKGVITTASVYFRDLSNGPTFGINEDDEFVSASLLKLPLAMTIYKLIEQSPEILSKEIVYDNPSEVLTQWFDTKKKDHHIEIGKPYPVRELVRYAVSYSDNYATDVLLGLLNILYPNKNILLQTFQDLGIIAPHDSLDNNLSPKEYASLFRLLYNISYLDKNSSDEILKMLANSSFDKGLKAGVPKGITIAHKYGERGGLEKDQKQLHDCGIVYYPENPYLICIMTRGYDFDKLAEVIKTVSHKMYAEFDSRNPVR